MTHARRLRLLLAALVPLLLLLGCAKYNTYYNAKRSFDKAEQVREDRIEAGEDPTQPTGPQVQDYQKTIRKCQKLLDEYPGHGLTDDSLFLMGKSYHRLQSYRMSITQLNLLFQNFPANPFTEEAVFTQALNYMFIGDVGRSNDYLEQLADRYPDSRYQAEAVRVSGENAYSLERWDDAAAAFNDFLTLHADDEHAPRVGLLLARTLWELRDFAGAADRLEAVLMGEVVEKEELFDVKVLLGRCLVRLDRRDEAAELFDEVEPEAELYGKEGLVALGRGESAYRAGDMDEAKDVLSAMPDTWRTRHDVGALAGEILGELYLAEGDLEQAVTEFRIASRGADVCRDEQRVRLLNRELQRYLEMENRLDGAREEDRPSYRLTQANVLFQALDRPREALDVYLEVAAAAEHDSTAAVRGLFGAAMVYREALAMPDSADALLARLVDDFPDSPQAHVVREGDRADLYAYLKQRERVVAVAQAAAGPTEEEEGLEAPVERPDRPVATRPAGRYSGWRQRKIDRNRGLGRG